MLILTIGESMKVIVIGAGPAGMMASISARECGHEVVLLEKNEKIGKKLFITGKGRCNITNDCDNRTFIANVVSNPKFLMGAIAKFDTAKTIAMCENNGVPVKTERGNRVFPESDKSSDFIKMFDRMMTRAGVDLRLNSTVDKLVVEDNKIKGVVVNGKFEECDKVIVATGGKSYPGTGSTGDGYTFAESVGHKVTPILPALVGIHLKEEVSDLAGLSLKNVTASVVRDGKVLAEEFGEMLFTHSGVSGPIILSISSRINKQKGNLKLVIDLKPSLNEEQLDARLLRDFAENQNKEFRNAISDITVKALVPIVIQNSGISPSKKVHQITKAERERLVYAIKHLTYTVQELCNISTAIVTSGGVDVKEINPKNMQSKLVEGLYFCGEVLDVDAVTGGFNIQIALSTGYIAGKCE